MKLTYRYLFACLFTILIKTGISQELQIGQTMPNYTFNNVLNYEKDHIVLSDFKGKLVIFDFWSFYCTPCLENFPKIDSFQQRFHNQIQVILVNRGSKEKTREFFEKRKRLNIPKNVPLVTTDTLLNNILPHQGVPFYAWIDGNGKLCYTTHEQVTVDKINRHLQGDSLLYTKAADTKYLKTVFEKDVENHVKYGTLILKGADTLNLHIDYPGDNIPYDCRSIQDLYQFAYNESDNDAMYGFREHGRTILEVKEIEKYKYLSGTSYDKWRGEHGYYYQSILPEALKKDKYKIMREDLRRYFNLNVSIEKRKVRCLALIRTSGKDKLKTKGGKPEQTTFSVELKTKDNDPENPSVRFIRNKPFQSLFDAFRSFGDWRFAIKVIDSTGYNGNIDFEMKEYELENLTIEGLRKVLKRYDLDLVERYIYMDVLILKEKK
ncbi:MAG: TlpA family protein disulfide reductase [Chitinophagaceae bacterium]|nr:TlpA family protein disulfide reductase [Chitinophagaceae bacterium]